MQQLYSERVFLNIAGKESSQTVRLTLHLKDSVDGQILKDAVEATRLRYPYHCVKLCIAKDDNGLEHYAYDNNMQPWVTTQGRKQVTLLSKDSNDHLLAFAWWDSYIALDFFYPLTDGTGAYRILRTLLYEYCRRRYDNTLSNEGVWTFGDTISEEELVDPATLPRPTVQPSQSATEKPQAINLFSQAKAPYREDLREVIHILLDESEVMQHIHKGKVSPTSWFSALLARAIGHLHLDATPAVPTISIAVNLRQATGTPLAHQPMVGSIPLPLRQDLLQQGVERQSAEFREMILEQIKPENLQAYYWKMQDGVSQLEQVPSLKMRHDLLTQAHQQVRQTATASLSYVGKANMGAAEQYIQDIRTESTSLFPILVEISAVNGTYCISFMQLFTEDDYLNAFVDELKKQGLHVKIADRHPIELAPIADFRQGTN